MQPILQHLFKKNTLQDIPVEKLQQLTSEFPYFAVGQYLLSRKLNETKDLAYEDQFQKTLIYFYNPLWLQYKLSEPQTQVNISEADNSIYNETKNTVVSESSYNTGQLSHDLVEEVVLHQENDFLNDEITIQAPQIPLEAHSIEIINGNQEPQIQTIQREEPFTFQAYYTVDYFASQGIKLSQDNQQQDKLGRQLKSFTEWLKTMRRLPETSLVEILDKVSESEITKIAAHSLEEKEVITESMAEVLSKQGQLEKARELYHKLSLQNPQKSTYFAGKIEDLKLH